MIRSSSSPCPRGLLAGSTLFIIIGEKLTSYVDPALVSVVIDFEDSAADRHDRFATTALRKNDAMFSRTGQDLGGPQFATN